MYGGPDLSKMFGKCVNGCKPFIPVASAPGAFRALRSYLRSRIAARNAHAIAISESVRGAVDHSIGGQKASGYFDNLTKIPANFDRLHYDAVLGIYGRDPEAAPIENQ